MKDRYYTFLLKASRMGMYISLIALTMLLMVWLVNYFAVIPNEVQDYSMHIFTVTVLDFTS